MKITFILPAIGKKTGEKYIGTWKMEPLTIAVLNSLTPEEFERDFFDDRIELIDYDNQTDLVVITVETHTAKRSYQIAREFRRRGVPVVLGGYHVTLNPEEAGEHADCIVTGNAEKLWGELLKDLRRKQLKKTYQGGIAFGDRLPDKRIFKGKKYLPVSLVETGRGCGYNCEFCAISCYYQCCYYKRDHDQILADLARSENKYHFLVDDNLMADIENAKTLFEKITPLKNAGDGQGYGTP